VTIVESPTGVDTVSLGGDQTDASQQFAQFAASGLSGDTLSVNTITGGPDNFTTEIEAGSSIEVLSDSNVAPVVQDVAFQGADATLKLDNAAGFAGTIADFTNSDKIDLEAIGAMTAAVNASDQLVVKNGAAPVATLQLAGSYSGIDFGVSSDGAGGSDVAILPPPAPPAGTTADMILRDGANGDYEIYDIGNNAILAGYALGQIGLSSQVVGVGGFNGSDTTDMMLRNTTTGAFAVYDISGNTITASAAIGMVG
jgi:hypothetical protein